MRSLATVARTARRRWVAGAAVVGAALTAVCAALAASGDAPPASAPSPPRHRRRRSARCSPTATIPDVRVLCGTAAAAARSCASGTPRRSRFATSSCRRWRAASSAIRVPPRRRPGHIAQPRSRRRRWRCSAGSTTGATSSSSTSAAPAARRRCNARTPRERDPLSEQSDPDRQVPAWRCSARRSC